MAQKTPSGEWIDPKGKSVPVKYVKPIDRKRDSIVSAIVRDALKMETKMRAQRKKMISRLRQYDVWLADQLGVDNSKKGNIQLTGFSGTQQVSFQINDVITFSETLRHAKTLIDECIKDWSDGANQNLKVIVDQSFTVDKKGNINTRDILKLRSLNIKDVKWIRAMTLISDSIQVEGTRAYIHIKTRENAEDPWETINLNFSNM